MKQGIAEYNSISMKSNNFLKIFPREEVEVYDLGRSIWPPLR